MGKNEYINLQRINHEAREKRKTEETEKKKKRPAPDPLFHEYLAKESKYYPRSWGGY